MTTKRIVSMVLLTATLVIPTCVLGQPQVHGPSGPRVDTNNPAKSNSPARRNSTTSNRSQANQKTTHASSTEEYASTRNGAVLHSDNAPNHNL